LPFPSLSAQILPPWASTIFLATYRPRPAPFKIVYMKITFILFIFKRETNY
jgi:hypothetical protein